MEPGSVGAVLMIGHFIVSIFNVQLGNPVIYSLPFTTMEQCEAYNEYLPKQPIQLDIEWMHHTKSQCFTADQFKQMMKRQQGTAPVPPQKGDEGV
jgi:hypothetical protein